MLWFKSFAFILIYNLRFSSTKSLEYYKNERRFPENFVFGVATASYQIEGAWNVSGKGENIWDHMVHTKPDVILDKSNGDVACDSYHQYKRDIEMLQELGVHFYRFSLSWSRILPSGSVADVNQDGVNYYNKLIDGLISKNVIPLVTIYHWDLPESLQKLGGWTNPLIQTYYEDYANLVFKLFGDRVKHWLTFNEPKQTCLDGYGSTAKAPAKNISGIGEYLCGHNLLNSHARVYHLYNNNYRIKQGGNIGITIEATWGEALSVSDDKDAAERYMQFDHGWFMNPIFSKKGDYPQIMKDRIAARSSKQGYSKSRLPEFTREQIKLLRGSSDYLGLNFYSSEMVKNVLNDSIVDNEPSHKDDMGVVSYVNTSWPGSASKWLKVTPWGFKKMLKRIREEYNNPEVLITENGYSTRGGLIDNDRIKYLNLHLNAMLDAIEDGSRVQAYTVWSLMDNFEWMSGYTERFGLYEVDFTSPSRTRIARKSAMYFSNVIRTNSVNVHDPEYYELYNDINHVYI